MKVHVHIDDMLTEKEIHIYAPAYDAQIESLLQQFGQSPQQTMIGYKDADLYVLKLENIFSITIEDGKVWIQTDEDEFEGRVKLYELEQKFPHTLVRIHKSMLVNIHQIIAIKARILNSPQVILANDVSLPVSRKYFPLLKEKIGVMHGGDKG